MSDVLTAQKASNQANHGFYYSALGLAEKIARVLSGVGVRAGMMVTSSIKVPDFT